MSFAQSLDKGLIVKLEKVLEENQMPGAMISIVQNDSILFAGGVGYANIENKESIHAGHLFRMGSISKTFTAFGILKLVDENKLKLSDAVKKIDPSLEIKNKWKKQSPITVEQILEHTAGFDDVQKDAQYNTEDMDAPACSSLVKVHKKSLYARWKPGERMSYSNPGYVLAGHLIEHLSKKPYNTYLKEEILQALDMNQSGFYYKQKEGLNLAQGYKRMGGQLQAVPFQSVHGGPASDFCTNAKDMCLFLKFLLSEKAKNENELISLDLLERMRTPKTSIAAKNGYKTGYGLGTTSLWSNNHLFYGHDGGIDGFSSLYLFSKEANFALAVSINSETDPWVLAKEILDYFLGKNKYKDSSAVTIPSEIKNQFTGFYNFKNPRNQSFHFIQKMFDGHSIEFKENRMLVKDFRSNVLDTLYHKGSNQFYRKNEGVPFVMLLENKGVPILWLGNDYAEKGSKGIRSFLNYGLFGIVFFSCLYFFVGLFWMFKDFMSKPKKRNSYNILLWFTTFLLLLFIISFIFADEFYQSTNPVNFGSVLLGICSAAFLIFSIGSLVKSFKINSESKMLKIYQRLTAFSLFALAIFCLYNGLMDFGF